MISGVEQLVDLLRRSAHTVVLTGAGVSAESGVPTFRDAQTGLWAKYRPEELATPEAFAANPTLVWSWYASRRAKLHSVDPNPGHLALAAFESILPVFTLITQNVDGLHQRAGSQQVIEFHGNIHRTVCSQPGCAGVWQPADEREPPLCPDCGAFMRPGVVWFGESIPEQALNDSIEAVQKCDVFITAGTSSVVHPAAGLVSIAADRGAAIVEINIDDTPATSAADVVIKARSGEALALILQQLE